MAETRSLARTSGNSPAPVAAHRSNLISLSEEVLRLTPFHVLKTKQVKLNPDPRAGDVYPADFVAKGMFAPAKNGLLKMIRTAGAVLAPDLCLYTVADGRVYNPDGSYAAYEPALRYFWAYRSVIFWAGSDGRPMPAIGSKEVDLREDGEAIKSIRSNPNKKGWQQDKEISQLRQFGSLMAETKSILRAARQVLQIKQAFTLEELAQPFEVQCLEYSPDLTDPEVRAIVITQGQAATASLFGSTKPPAALEAPKEPEQQPTAPEVFPVEGVAGWGDSDDYDADTGEVHPPDEEETVVQEFDAEAAVVGYHTRIAEAGDLDALNAIGADIQAAPLPATDKKALRAAWESQRKALAA